ncbi:MAG: glycoside hydrolase [Bacteroidaceae bacterium]|nr:glycoside hydrolase [Bacteroidaceae bacterium]
MKPKLFLLLCLLLANFNALAQPVIIDLSNKAQKIEGWGVSLCWWAHMCGTWSEENVDKLVDWLVSPEGLNMNVFRYNIGGGDDPENRNCEQHHMGKGKGIRAEMPGFKLYPDSEYDWQADSAQIRILLKIKKKRPDAVFEAFSNSAPWYMTKSGCVAGAKGKTEDNLKPESYADFAKYLVDVCVHFKEAYGVEFYTLEPFNESYSDYWYQNGSQEGCHFNVESQVEVLKVLSPLLKASGLKTTISASDETSTAHSLSVLSGYSDAIPLIAQWNTHTYSATNEERQLLHDKVMARGLRLWQSETGSGGKGIEGNLKLLQRLFDDIRYLQPSVWCDWQYVEEVGDQWCTVTGNFETQNFARNKNYYVRQQVTRFIKQGYTILQVDHDQTLAAIAPDGKEVILVMINNLNAPVEYNYKLFEHPMHITQYTTDINLNMKKEEKAFRGKLLSVSLNSQSVSTIVIHL